MQTSAAPRPMCVPLCCPPARPPAGMPLWYAPPFLPVQVVTDFEYPLQQQQHQQLQAAGGGVLMLPAPGDQRQQRQQSNGMADANQQALRYFADPGT